MNDAAGTPMERPAEPEQGQCFDASGGQATGRETIAAQIERDDTRSQHEHEPADEPAVPAEFVLPPSARTCRAIVVIILPVHRLRARSQSGSTSNRGRLAFRDRLHRGLQVAPLHKRRAVAKQRDQRQPDGKLEAQDEESADRCRDDGPSVGCELTAGEWVVGDKEDNRGGGEESPCAADLPAYRRGHTEEPLGPAFPTGHPGQDSGNESAQGQAVEQGRAQEPEVARPRAQPRRLARSTR